MRVGYLNLPQVWPRAAPQLHPPAICILHCGPKKELAVGPSVPWAGCRAAEGSLALTAWSAQGSGPSSAGTDPWSPHGLRHAIHVCAQKSQFSDNKMMERSDSSPLHYSRHWKEGIDGMLNPKGVTAGPVCAALLLACIPLCQVFLPSAALEQGNVFLLLR